MGEPQGSANAAAQTLESMTAAAYWRRLCPELTVSECGGDGGGAAAGAGEGSGGGRSSWIEPVALPPEAVARLRAQLSEQGYFTLPPACLPWPPGLMAKLAKAVVLLLQAGWSAAFVAMYDEVWELCAALGGLMAAVSGTA